MRRVVPLALALAGVACTSAHGAAPNIVNGPPGREALTRWTAAEDPANAGLHAGWRTGAFAGRTVEVPYVFNATRVTGTAGIASFKGGVGWYRTTIDVPADGRYAIRFESVNHRAAVFVDGAFVVGHVGTYEPFEVRRTLTAGEHTIVVRADWRDPKRMRAEGWHRTWFNFGGINREVTLRRVGASEVQRPTLTTRLEGDDAVVSLAATVRNHGVARALPVTGTLAGVAFTLGAPELPTGARRRIATTVRIPNARLWSPGEPTLHDLDLATPDGPAWHARVGLRELTWADGDMRLNGKPLILRGASLQEDVRGKGDALDGPDQSQVALNLLGMGANATRSQHPLDEGLLERMDQAGILVWQGVGPVDAPADWTSTTPALQKRARSRVRATVRQAQLHPSIIAWNLVNEVADNGAPGGQAAFIRTMATELHGSDPGRMVAVDVWGVRVPRALGPLYGPVDAIGVTNYLGWYEEPFATTARLTAGLQGRTLRLERIFAGKVLVISEFGAEGNTLNAAGRPGGLANQARVVGQHVDAYAQAADLDGWLVWNLQDFGVSPAFAGGRINRLVPGIRLVRGLNQKGLVTYEGRPKPAMDAVRARHLRLQAEARARGGL